MRLILICFLPIFLWSKPATLSAIIDGDTLVFLEKERKIICQLAFVDAPEISSNKRTISQEKACQISLKTLIDAGKSAKDFIAKNININQEYELKIISTSKNAWVNCIIYIPQGTHTQLNPSLNVVMLDQGYAVFYNSAPHDEKLSSSMKERANLAKREFRGLWKKAPEVMECLDRSNH